MLTNMIFSPSGAIGAQMVDGVFSDLNTSTFSNLFEKVEKEEDASKNVVGKLQFPKQKLCHVCGNVGATSHYGGTVCGGCKIFFSRTVQSRKGFVCERDGQCPMSAGKRAKCRACRFQLCLRAHMSPEEVGRLRDMRMTDFPTQIVKKEGSVVGYFDEKSQPSTSLTDCVQKIVSFVDIYSKNLNNGSEEDNEMAVLKIFVNLERSCENNGALKHAELFPRTCNASIDIISAIGFPIPICEKIPMDYIRKLMLSNPKSTLKLFWCRNVLHFLEWAAANEDLNQLEWKDKTQLIANNFMSVTCLISFFGFLRIQREGGQWECASEMFSEISKLSPESSISVQKAIFEILEPMDELDVTFEEIVLLKFIIMFTEPPSGKSSEIYRIRCYRLKYCELLRKFVKKQIPDPEKRIERISQLLKLIDSIRNASTYFSTWMTCFHTSNTCQMNDQLIFDFHVKNWNF